MLMYGFLNIIYADNRIKSLHHSYFLSFFKLLNKCRNWNICTHLKFENHLTSCAVLFLLNLMSGKYIFKIAEEGYRVQKNINFAFLKCIGVNVELCKSDMEYPENETKTHNWKNVFVVKSVFFISYLIVFLFDWHRAPERL